VRPAKTIAAKDTTAVRMTRSQDALEGKRLRTSLRAGRVTTAKKLQEMTYAAGEWKPSRQPTTRCVAARTTHTEASPADINADVMASG
jgi:hypothetical protein